MPAIQQRNGHATGNKMVQSSRKGSFGHPDDEDMRIKSALASKKMQLLESDDQAGQANGFHKAAPKADDCEVFQDLQTLSPHSGICNNSSSSNNNNIRAHNLRQDDEPIVIFGTQNNTSIAQTAKDQFAAALLRLQVGLDASTRRLDAIETKVEELVRQHRQQQQAKSAAAKKGVGSWSSALSGEGKLGTLLYLGWPVLVFVALRAIERRNLANKLT